MISSRPKSSLKKPLYACTKDVTSAFTVYIHWRYSDVAVSIVSTNKQLWTSVLHVLCGGWFRPVVVGYIFFLRVFSFNKTGQVFHQSGIGIDLCGGTSKFISCCCSFILPGRGSVSEFQLTDRDRTGRKEVMRVVARFVQDDFFPHRPGSSPPLAVLHPTQ